MDFSLFGESLFSEPLKQQMGGTIANKYIVPPFSILNTQEKRWQIRKRQWIKYGIKSEIGRTSKLTYQIGDMDEYRKYETEKKGKEGKGYNSDKYNTNLSKKAQRALGCYSAFGESTLDRNTGGIVGTSIFDPVLTELMYTWFCPKGGQIIDPFAGGSVRGILSTFLGYKYWGCDLRKEQILANKDNANEVFNRTPPKTSTIKVKISSKSLNQMFVMCKPNYIINNCKGRCCQGTGNIKVTIHKSEQNRIKGLKEGIKIKDSMLVADDRGLCPFKTDSGLCSIHDKKPFGCAASPFTLTKKNTLIVRNRYRMLKCYKTDHKKVPAYMAHKQSLVAIFGKKEMIKIVKSARKGNDCFAKISYQKYKMLIDNDFSKNKKDFNVLLPDNLEWVQGDSLETASNAPLSDFLFTCPPYGDLEIYSDDKRDISNMDYDSFMGTFTCIIDKSLDRLKENRFICVVVGDFRNKKGFYRGFVSDTIQMFQKGGIPLYNEFILKTAIGSLPVRIQAQFDSYKKIGRCHQNVLVFFKGDPKTIKETFKRD